ncbi:MAG: short-chain fatty acyl-CoA regulator family protein [Pseudomonadota bacterium]
MAGEKVFIGPRLRELRQGQDHTQAQMAAALGVSASYINLIERNQRSASLRFLIALSDTYGVDWRQMTSNSNSLAVADLRQLFRDPAFGGVEPDIEELRSALDSAPNLVEGVFNLFRTHRAYAEQLAAQNEAMGHAENGAMVSEPVVHDFFRSQNNYFAALEEAAESLHASHPLDPAEMYGGLKRYLEDVHKVKVELVPAAQMGKAVRVFDRENRVLRLSIALDYINRVFHLGLSAGFVGFRPMFDMILDNSAITNPHHRARCQVELGNYFAAAVMMPYRAFMEEALASRYDLEHLSTTFGVSFEQVCHRLTTMQRPGARGIPFFFLRIDRAGNVSKRFNATPIQLARFGGACPKLDTHFCFRMPGRIMTQVVEMPDNTRYFTVNRTVDRPSYRYSSDDKRLAVSLGCALPYAVQMVYGDDIDASAPRHVTEIGVNCRLCPRQNCEQRAHEPFTQNFAVDENRRGATRFES